MKSKILLFLFLFSNQLIFSQSLTDTLRCENIIGKEVSQTLFKYHNYKYLKSDTITTRLDSLEKIENKLDSLKIIDRKRLLKNISGKWKFIDSKCYGCIKTADTVKIKKFVVINNSHITFYNNKISKKSITRKEKINFTEKFYVFSTLTSLVFEDKYIWDFCTDKSKEYLRIVRSGEETNEGRSKYICGVSYEFYKRIK